MTAIKHLISSVTDNWFNTTKNLQRLQLVSLSVTHIDLWDWMSIGVDNIYV